MNMAPTLQLQLINVTVVNMAENWSNLATGHVMVYDGLYVVTQMRDEVWYENLHCKVF